MKGIDRLRNARDLLARRHGGGTPNRRDIEAAAQEFWAAMFHYDTWSDELQDRADRIKRRLFSDGIISETVLNMSETQLEQTANELLEFIDAAEQCESANNDAA